MTPTSVYAKSSGWDLAFVWPLARANSTLITGPQLQAGWVPTLRYTSLGGATHTSSVTEVVEWVQPLAPSDPNSQTGPDWTGSDQTGPDQTVPDGTGPNRTGPERTGLDWLGLNRTGPDRTGPDRTRPDRTGPIPLRRSPRLRPLAASASVSEFYVPV